MFDILAALPFPQCKLAWKVPVKVVSASESRQGWWGLQVIERNWKLISPQHVISWQPRDCLPHIKQDPPPGRETEQGQASRAQQMSHISHRDEKSDSIEDIIVCKDWDLAVGREREISTQISPTSVSGVNPGYTNILYIYIYLGTYTLNVNSYLPICYQPWYTTRVYHSTPT